MKFDHENVNRMDAVHPHTVNNEHDYLNNWTRAEAQMRTYDSHIISHLYAFASGEVDDETAVMMSAADYTHDGGIHQGVGGFGVFGPNTAIEYYREEKPQQKQGFLHNPFKKKEEPQSMAAPGQSR